MEQAPWYLVVQSDAASPGGMDGICWPLDALADAGDQAAAALQAPTDGDYLCHNEAFAKKYFDYANSRLARIQLLRIGDGEQQETSGNSADYTFLGFDYGRKDGGFSCLLNDMRTCDLLKDRYLDTLNAHMLFNDYSSALEYTQFRSSIEARDDLCLETVHASEILSVSRFTPTT